MAGGKVHVVMAGNPTIPSGAFYRCLHQRARPLELLHASMLSIRRTCRARPRAAVAPGPRRWWSARSQSLSPAGNQALGLRSVPAWWHGNEKQLAKLAVPGTGAFSGSGAKRAHQTGLAGARQAARATKPIGDDEQVPLVAGVDVGGGEAETVVYVCECNHDRRRIIAMGAWRGEDTRGQVVNFLKRFRSRLSIVRVDSIGIGPQLCPPPARLPFPGRTD